MKLRFSLSVVLLISMIPLCAEKSYQDIIIRKANEATPSKAINQKQPLKQAQEDITKQEETSEEDMPKQLTEDEQLEIFKQMNLPDTKN